VSAAAQILADLGRRGVRLALAADGIQYEAPCGTLTAADREAIAERRAEIVDLLRAEAEVPVRFGPCGLCRSPLAWVENWPMGGEQRWLCPTCATWPAPSLAEVFQTLTTEERQRLEAEAAQGDELASTVLRELDGAAARGTAS
jgi:TubC N-terminal docking domain